MSHDHSTAHEKGSVDPHDLGHILPKSTYRSTFIWLVVLTVVTVLAAAMEISKFSAMLAMVVALGIASVKASLVAANFMHLRYENPVTWLYAAFPLVLLAILIGLLFIDNPYRVSPSPDISTKVIHRPGEAPMGADSLAPPPAHH